MSEPQNPDENIYRQMKEVLKPMVDTVLSEKPKDVVS